MSHFTVLVIGEDPETLLAPYSEELTVEEYRDYEDGKPEDHWAVAGMIEDGELAKDFDGWEAFVAAWNLRYSDEPMYYDSERDQAYTLSTYNPKSKWDWYTLGGRWTGFFKLRDGATGEVGTPRLGGPTPKPGWFDRARKADIDWDAMRAQREAEAISEHAQAMAALAGCPPLLTWEQRAVGKVGLPFAILTADGWAEKGHMGWFACVTDEKADWDQTAADIITASPADAVFSLYDCHI